MLFTAITVPVASRSTVTTAVLATAIAARVLLVRVRTGYLSIFASALDALVTVLVQTGKIRP